MEDLSFKEHTKEKLDLIKSYCEEWFYIVKGQSCVIIDCNAGTGYNKIKEKKFLGTSLIATNLFFENNYKDYQLHLIEKDTKKYDLLRKNINNYIKKQQIAINLDTEIFIYNSDWTKVLDEICEKTKFAIRLFLLDPFGIEPLPWSKLKILLKRGISTFNYKESGIEILINWAWHKIRRILGKYYKQKSNQSLYKDKSLKRELRNLDVYFGLADWKNIADKYANNLFKSRNREKIELLRKELVLAYAKNILQYFKYVKIHSVFSRRKIKGKPYKERGTLKYYLIFATNYQPALDIIDEKFVEYRDKKFYPSIPETQSTLASFVSDNQTQTYSETDTIMDIDDRIRKVENELDISLYYINKEIIRFLFEQKNYDYGCFGFVLFDIFDIDENHYSIRFLKEMNILSVRTKVAKTGYTGDYYYLAHPLLVDRNEYLFFDDEAYIFKNGILERF